MEKRSRLEYSMLNMMVSFGGYFINVLCSFICRMVFTRCLSSEYLGINGLFSSILSMLSLTELGIGSAMIYALYKPIAENDERKIASYMHLYGKAYRIIGIVIFLLGLALLPFLKVLIKDVPTISENIYVLYLLYLFSTASSYFFSYRSSILMANQRNYIVVTISYFVTIIQNVIQIAILLITKNYLLYLIVQVVCIFITNILISKKALRDYPYINDKHPQKLSRSEVISLAKNIKALTVTKLSGVLVNNTDNIVITYFEGLIATGVISNFTLITSILSSFVNQIFSSFTASIGNLNAISDNEKKFAIFKSLNFANFWIYGWVAIGIAVLSNDIVAFAFGTSYTTNFIIPFVLALNFYMLGMQNVVGMYKSTMGLFRYGQYMLLLTATFNLIGDFILGHQYGVVGILIATVISRLFTNTWYEPYAVYRFGFNKKFGKYVLRYLAYAGILLFTGGICYLICSMVTVNGFFSLMIKFFICLIMPNLIFFCFFYRLSEFKYFYEVYRRIRNKMKNIIHK